MQVDDIKRWMFDNGFEVRLGEYLKTINGVRVAVTDDGRFIRLTGDRQVLVSGGLFGWPRPHFKTVEFPIELRLSGVSMLAEIVKGLGAHPRPMVEWHP